MALAATEEQEIAQTKGFLSVKGMTLTERMKQSGYNPWLITLGIYTIWHVTITALAYAGSSGIGATCTWSLTTDCSDPWQIWWGEYRIFAEIIWCVPFIAMLYLNPKILQKCRSIIDGLDISPAEKVDAAASIPSTKIRKFVFWGYALIFLTIGTVTHFDVLSFGVFGVLVLWPVYLIQAVLIADTFSMYNTLFILLKNRRNVIIEPFHKNGSAGLDHLADALTSIAVIPGIFTTVLMIRSGFFVILEVGEASAIRVWGEVIFGAGLLGIALLISMGPLYALAGPVRERKKDLIHRLSERCGFQGLNLEAMLDADINDRKVADMLLMERIQAIEPVDMKAVALIVRRFAVPAFLVLGRTLVGV